MRGWLAIAALLSVLITLAGAMQFGLGISYLLVVGWYATDWDSYTSVFSAGGLAGRNCVTQARQHLALETPFAFWV